MDRPCRRSTPWSADCSVCGTEIMDAYRRLQHVLRELSTYSGLIKRGPDASFVVCPFHSERTASGRIFHNGTSRNPGYFKCYGCGKTAKWDEVAPHLGLKPVKWAKPEEQFATPIRKRHDEKTEDREIRLSDLPRNKVWRSIPTNFLIKIGCRRGRFYYPDNAYEGEVWIYMPVIINGEVRGYSRGRLRKDPEKPSYINSPGNWSRDYGLFPYDYTKKRARKLRYVVLVEGQRDAIRLLMDGIPALAIMGTQSWSNRKSRMIELLDLDFVILMMDGDDAGIKAIELIQPQLENLVTTEVFSLTGKDSPYWPFRKKAEPSKAAKAAGVELWDPMNLPNGKLTELRTSIEKWSAKHGRPA